MKKDIIRVGDLVKIVKPERFERCGYELTHNDATEAAVELYKEELNAFFKAVNAKRRGRGWGSLNVSYLESKVKNKIERALGYLYIGDSIKDGNERKIFTLPMFPPPDRVFKVTKVFYCQTGKYFGPSGGYDSYSGEWDQEPGGLTNVKTHKILEFDVCMENDYLKIEACNVEKVCVS